MSEYTEHRVIGHILFNGALYEIAGQDKEHIIRLSDLGLEFEKPTSEVHYSDLYILENDKIYLDAIRLENCWGRFPVINGVKAVSAAGAIFYKGLKRLVSYTGTIIVKRVDTFVFSKIKMDTIIIKYVRTFED